MNNKSKEENCPIEGKISYVDIYNKAIAEAKIAELAYIAENKPIKGKISDVELIGIDELLSISDISLRFHEPYRRVAYVIGKHCIKHAKHIGNTRVFNKAAVVQIKQGLFGIHVK